MKNIPQEKGHTPKTISRRDLIKLLTAGSGLLLFPVGQVVAADKKNKNVKYDWRNYYWGFAVDTTKCIGCCSCMRACRAENNVPEGYYRTWVERYRVKPDGEVQVDVAINDRNSFSEIKGDTSKAFFVPKLCNHCKKSVCNQFCPVGASFTTNDGVVLVDPKHCIGCGYCVQACPYGSRFINPKTHLADKCTLCYHRITKGLHPACAQACPTNARIFGNLKDPKSHISVILRQRRFRVLRPEMGTHPKCYYLGLDQEVI